jgi:hypothetical protein
MAGLEPEGRGKGKGSGFPCRAHESPIEGVDVFLEGQGLQDNPLLRGESRDQAFPPTTILHGVKESRIGITLDHPVLPAALSPVQLLHLCKVGELMLQVVSKGPSLIIQPLGIHL